MGESRSINTAACYRVGEKDAASKSIYVFYGNQAEKKKNLQLLLACSYLVSPVDFWFLTCLEPVNCFYFRCRVSCLAGGD
ncbi:MAG: hypothetical protein BWY80_01025 [Firmicutes bacterium ADurb.Bin456]|nr:MAG: hypothetical protein BWY80_01025 [Firmicutes bacterium ADurb.Bin456]